MENTTLTVSGVDVNIVMKNMKNRKSHGPSSINFKLIKYGGRNDMDLVASFWKFSALPAYIKTV
jgi:hypothetical protein